MTSTELAHLLDQAESIARRTGDLPVDIYYNLIEHGMDADGLLSEWTGNLLVHSDCQE